MADIANLPPDSIYGIFSFLSLSEILSPRLVCRSFRKACDNDPRWLPIISPPTLSREVLSLHQHGKYLRRLYFQYEHWKDRYVQYNRRKYDWNDDRRHREERWLRNLKSALDGFFSLAPWHQDGSMFYPTPWLHGMVYHQPCPTIAAPTSTETRIATVPPKMKTIRTNQDDEMSTFFQQRVRPSIDNFRFFLTHPIDLESYDVKSTQKIRVIIQPVNFRKQQDGSKRDRLPDHDAQQITTWNDAGVKFLECYFGKGRVLSPSVIHHRGLTGRWGNCRNDVQGRRNADGPVVQVNAAALAGLSSTVLHNVDTTKEADEFHNILVYTIAPHMYHIRSDGTGNGFAWMFSTPLDDDEGEPWAISTFQFRQEISDPCEQVRQYIHSLFYAILYQLDGLKICENNHCVLNNVDGLEEAESSSPLILCPACVRKLQLCGAVNGDDAPKLMRRLHKVLSQEPFATVCQSDVLKLEEYGFGT